MFDSGAAPVGFGTALREQLRWFWQRLRWFIVLVTIALSLLGFWIVRSAPAEAGGILAMAVVAAVLHPLFLLVALSWAFSAWRDDPPRDRQYFWLHPVGRDRHTVARTAAGGIWLLGAFAVIAAVVLAALLLGPEEATLGTSRFWLYWLASGTLAYIVASITPVLSNRPGMWLLGFVAIIIFAALLAQVRDLAWLHDAIQLFTGGKYSLGTALSAPSHELMRGVQEAVGGGPADVPAGAREAAPGAALLIWLPVAALAYSAAVRLSRPR